MVASQKQNEFYIQNEVIDMKGLEIQKHKRFN